MKLATLKKYRVHPFPARMAPTIVWHKLNSERKRLRILDPMAGSGTTLVVAKTKGHRAVGFDTDPLAVLISKTWCSEVNESLLTDTSNKVLSRAKKIYSSIPSAKAYPHKSDKETRKFIRFWFDRKNRKQLAALSQAISEHGNESVKTLLWCAFSRLIITKKIGVSRAMDISHSRPHRVYDTAPVTAFDRFPISIQSIIKAAPFTKNDSKYPTAKIKLGDARALPLKKESIDMVITSPPYLNAIDYLRGHKLSLVWMGHSISNIRTIRTDNIGAEVSRHLKDSDQILLEALKKMGRVEKLSNRWKGMLINYLRDMDNVLKEIHRVLIKDGKAILVVGDCMIKSVFISNSKGIQCLSEDKGLRVISVKKRPLPDNRRYLPPPSLKDSGKAMQRRMREEVIITLQKL